MANPAQITTSLLNTPLVDDRNRITREWLSIFQQFQGSQSVVNNVVQNFNTLDISATDDGAPAFDYRGMAEQSILTQLELRDNGEAGIALQRVASLERTIALEGTPIPVAQILSEIKTLRILLYELQDQSTSMSRLFTEIETLKRQLAMIDPSHG